MFTNIIFCSSLFILVTKIKLFQSNLQTQDSITNRKKENMFSMIPVKHKVIHTHTNTHTHTHTIIIIM